MHNLKYSCLLLIWLPVYCFGQCTYTWEKTDHSGKITTKKPYYTTSPNDTVNINFEALIEQIKIPRFEDELSAHLRSLIDTLRRIDTDSARKEILMITDELASVFQSLKQGPIEYVLYDIDTFRSRDKHIPLYRFSTSFYKEWNEDFDNWMFIYTREFGVLKSYETSIYMPSFTQYMLADNCHIPEQQRKLKNEIMNYIRTSSQD